MKAWIASGGVLLLVVLGGLVGRQAWQVQHDRVRIHAYNTALLDAFDAVRRRRDQEMARLRQEWERLEAERVAP